MFAFRYKGTRAGWGLHLFLVIAAFFGNAYSQDTLITASYGDRERIPGGTSASSDNYNVDFLGRWGSGLCKAAAVEGDKLYHGNGACLQIMDISDPFNPLKLGEILLPWTILDIAIEGAYAYVADGNGGVRIVDISHPESPVETGYLLIPRADGTNRFVANGIAVKWPFAYVGDMYIGLTILDISSPVSPVRVGYLDTAHPGRDVALMDSFVCLADDYDGLRIINVSDPTAPILAGYYDMEGYAMDVCLRDSLAYVATWQTGITILDLSEPSSPELVSNCDTEGQGTGVCLSGSYACLADQDYGIRIIDISDPSSPFEAGYYDTRGKANNIAVIGSCAYVADEWNGLCVLNLSDPSNPEQVGFIETGDYLQSVAVSGSFAYVAASRDGLRILDISNPSSPEEVGYLETGDYAWDVAVNGSYVYLAAGKSGLAIVDVSVPSSPVEVACYDPGGDEFGVTLKGSCAYIAAGSAGLRILDVSIPSSPVEIGFYNTSEFSCGVDINGSYAYVADGYGGLRIIDISTPQSPVELGFYEYVAFNHAWECFVYDNAVDVAVSGNYAWLANGGSGDPFSRTGMAVLDVSDPTNPIELDFYRANEGLGVTLSGSFLYLAGGLSGLRVFDVSDPAAVSEVGYYDGISGLAGNVAVCANTAYVAGGEGGLYILNCGSVSVLLQMMDAAVEKEGVKITWETSGENGVKGYQIYRQYLAEDGRFEPLSGLLPADGTGRYEYLDTKAVRGEKYLYRLAALEKNGAEVTLGEKTIAFGVPPAMSLEQNFPNPFNPGTEIRFTVPERMEVDLSVYDVSGRHVVTLIHGTMAPGPAGTRWNGRDKHGREASSGVYFCRLKVGKNEASRRMVLLR